MPEMRRANEAIESAVRENEVRLTHAAQFKRQLATTDRLLDLLERMNLAEIDRIGEPTATRISRAVEGLPPPLRPVVRPTTTVQCALDQVFEIQKVLFSQRTGRRTR